MSTADPLDSKIIVGWICFHEDNNNKQPTNDNMVAY